MKLLIRVQLILFSYVAFADGMALSSWWLKGHTISRIVNKSSNKCPSPHTARHNRLDAIVDWVLNNLS